MPNTYTELRRTVVGTATPSVTFDLTGISGYTDLVIVANGTSSGDASFQVQFNGDTSSGLYSTTFLYGTGSSAVSGRSSSANFIVGMGRTNTTGGASILQLQNYANTNTFKTIIGKGGGAASLVITSVGLWRNTNAITSIVLTPEGSNTISIGSTFSLYGIANADQGAAKATGGIITEDSQYWYHTFGASGAFIPKQALTCDVLTIAGGGGGGYHGGAGGGAGGLLYSASQSLSSGVSYTASIGGGGAPGNNGTHAANGTNSTFSGSGFTTLTAVGGGGAGGYLSLPYTGNAGGSGGGAWGTHTGGLNTSGQGNVGGDGSAGGSYNEGAGGGGGAGAAGQTAVSGSYQGAGGAGSSAYSSWGLATGTGQNVSGTVFYAGGGGGGMAGNSAATFGAGGNGGGGVGANKAVTVNGTSGTANTGGGAGGGGYNGTPGTIGTPGTGGSGVVIVRYAK